MLEYPCDFYMANLLNLSKKDLEILNLLKNNEEGIRTNILLKALNFKLRTLYNHLEKLEKEGLIKNIYPIWKICQNQNLLSKLAISNTPLQAHKFSFVLNLVFKPDWWEKRQNRLIKLKEFSYQDTIKWGNNKYLQLQKDQFLIHIFKDSIFFINQKKYYASDPYLALNEAIEDTLRILDILEEEVRFKFFKDGIPQFSVKTNHFVKINDEIAKKCKESRNMLEVKINGKLRAWVDMSQPFGLETGNKDYAVSDMDKYKNYLTDIISKDILMPSEEKYLINQNALAINGLIQNANYNAEYLKSHTGAMIKLDKSINRLTKFIYNQAKENKDLKLKSKHQLTLLDY